MARRRAPGVPARSTVVPGIAGDELHRETRRPGTRNGPRWAWPMAAVVVAAVAVACEGGAGGTALPDGPPVVTVGMTEYDFDHPSPVPAGRVVFRFVNEGRLVHQPDLLPLPEDLPPIDEQLRGDQRAAITPFAGIPPREPGEVGTYAVDLVPGQRYAIICFARDPDDDESHALQGMATEFRAGGGTQPPSTPAGAATTTSTTTTTTTTTSTTRAGG